MSSTIVETNIWIIRHGEPEDVAQGRCYGRLDVGLSPQGRLQLERVAAHLRGEPLAAIYASPRQRATESASILGSHHACGIEILEGMREIDFGDFEGLSYDEIALALSGDLPELDGTADRNTVSERRELRAHAHARGEDG